MNQLEMTCTQKFEHLRMVCEAIPENGLDMRAWSRHIMDDLQAGEVATCGTVACLGGWAASDPVFVAAGLSLRVSNGRMLVPEYKGLQGYTALSAFFPLGYWTQSVYGLFCPDEYPNPSNVSKELVLKRIDVMIERAKAVDRVNTELGI